MLIKEQLLRLLLSILLLVLLLVLPLNGYWMPQNIREIKNGMVVSDQALASQLGIEILQRGGNAIDAAVAVGYALAVVQPCCGNMGGGGFMTIRFQNGRTVFINFRETAPSSSTQNMFLDADNNLMPEKSKNGYLAVAVPGTVLGLLTALTKYGTLSRQTVIEPAIELAENGFTLTAGDVELLSEKTERFRSEPNVAAIFLNNNEPYKVGEKLIQKDLAHSLKLIAKDGARAFYEGPIAEKIVAASQENGGILSLKDFEHYNVTESEPLQCCFKKKKIITAPLPSSGGILLCEMLKQLEQYPLSEFGFHTTESVHLIAETMRRAFAGRDRLGDADFIKKQPETPNKTNTNTIQETHNTTHYAVIDRVGNIVSVTYTLNSKFGAGVIAKDTGILLNNEMDDFTAKLGAENQFGLVQGSENFVEPGKQPLSSMTPTIILNEKNEPLMALGAAGGSRIPTAVLQTIVNVMDYHLPIQDAVNAPRFHHQYLPNVLMAEPQVFTDKVYKNLKNMGYDIEYDGNLGIVEAFLIDPKTGNIEGASDRRRPAGKAVGY